MSLQLQQTEIGKFPSDWEIDRVDSAFDIQQGKQVSSRNRDGVHQRPFLRTKNVFWNRLELTDLDEMHFSEAEQTRLELRVNDLLVCEGGSIGRTALWNNEIEGCLYQNHLHRLRVKDQKADAQFSAYWLWYAFDVAKLYFGRGNVTTIPNLSQSKLAELPMALPPLPEQKKIAHILSTVHRAIEAQERIIQTTTELKKVLMHKLFTEGLRGEPQKQTEIGPVPESWEAVKIKDHCIDSAFGPRYGSELYAADGNILTLRTTDMEDDGRIDYNTAPLARIEYAKFEKHYLQVGDIVVSRSGTCGIASVFEGHQLPVLPGAFLIRLRMKDSVQPMFLRHYINSPVGRPYVLQLAQGAIQKNISGTRLGDLLIPLPSRAEQEGISAAVRTIDTKLASHRQKLATNRDLFRSLLNELMTAKIRVHKLEGNS
jgi:type I restriction enzyme S subunit